MKIKARFMGTNGLMGYRKGAFYTLNIETVEQKNIFGLLIGYNVVIYRDGHVTHCPYSSVESFLKNWDNIKVLK